MLNRLTQSMDFQAQALSLRAERQRLIASNIANADTPGYVARDMNFAQALKEATGAVPVAGQMARPSRATSSPRPAPAARPAWPTHSIPRPVWTATPWTWTASGPASPRTR